MKIKLLILSPHHPIPQFIIPIPQFNHTMYMIKLEVSAYIMMTMWMFTAEPRLQYFLCIPSFVLKVVIGQFLIGLVLFVFVLLFLLFCIFFFKTLCYGRFWTLHKVYGIVYWTPITQHHQPMASATHLYITWSFVFSSGNITDFVFKIWIQH